MTEQANKLSLAEEEELLAAKSERIRRRFKSSFIYLLISFFMEGFKLKIKKNIFHRLLFSSPLTDLGTRLFLYLIKRNTWVVTSGEPND